MDPFFGCFLHLAYKLPLKNSKLEEIKKISSKKTKINQNKFKERLGLIVDKLKPEFRNSNDGNTARRFFIKPEISVDITRLNIG